MLDHIFINTPDVKASIEFYSMVLSPLNIHYVLKYDGADGPKGHPDLFGFGSNGRVYFWLREGRSSPETVHIGFIAKSVNEVDAFHRAAMAAGAKEIEPAGARLHYDPKYYAAKIKDPNGYSIEAVYKSWQHEVSYD